MRWLHFILSHSVFISLCAVALCFQTTILLKLPFDYMLGGMVFFSTMAGYNLYWALSKYTFSRPLSLKEILAHNCSHLILAFSGGLFLLYYLYRQPSTLHFMLVAFLLTTAYSLPLWPLKFAQKFRKTGFLKTIILSFTWAYVTVIIPAIPVLKNHLAPVLVLLAARFFFMLILCLIFDVRDKEVDKIHNLHSLATDISSSAFKKLALLVFFGYFISGIFLRFYFSETGQVIAFSLSFLGLIAIYLLSLKKRGYVFYYFLVDGMMLFTSIASFIASL